MLDAATDDGDGAVLIAGAGHTRRDFGVPAIIRERKPGASVVSVSMVAVDPEMELRRLLSLRDDMDISLRPLRLE
jgi:uncharacterized iron-regulated protein